MPKITFDYEEGRQIKSTWNFLFSINREQFRQTLLVVTYSLMGVETTKLACKNE